MSDGSDEVAERRPTLVYPFERTPEPGSGGAVEVAPGVHWLRMPLGGALKFINVWALEDGDGPERGWTIVDTGIQTKETAAAWRAAFAGFMGGRPVRRVLCTHMHPDHCGMAGWIARKFDATLWMSRLEYITCRMLSADTGREAPEEGLRFFRAAGWDEEALENYRTRFGGFGKGVYPLPQAYHRLDEAEPVRIGGRDWRVVMGNGHSPEHACLYCPELQVLISGDQVLPKISSIVSLHPTEPDADPLADWLGSLAKLKREIPDETLVLPAHNDPFRGLHARLDHLDRGHRVGLERLEQRLAQEPRRAIDVFGALFARPIGPDLLGMATGESLAHLNHLLHTGRAVRETDAHGVQW